MRTRLHLSQESIARIIGVHQATVSKWERGLTRPNGAALKMINLIENHPDIFGPAPSEPPDNEKNNHGNI